jgi:hypothetical protein
MRKAIVGVAVAVGMFIAAAGAAAAAPPGPGDKQCIPGQQGNPHPAHKAGACRNP